MNKVLIILSALALLLQGCSSNPVQDEHEIDIGGNPLGYPIIVPLSRNAIANHIRDRYRRLRGVPYRMGGESADGFDCSGFSRHLFASLLGLRLPRTTSRQARLGRLIDRSQLHAGDPIFFQLPSYPQHVGVYLDAGEFVHASSSQGVTISHLDSGYWRRHYWMARRIVVPTNET